MLETTQPVRGPAAAKVGGAVFPVSAALVVAIVLCGVLAPDAVGDIFGAA